MRPSVRVLALAAALLILATLVPLSGAVAAPIGISGTVYYSATALPDIEVQLQDSGRITTFATVRTDAAGKFAFSGVGQGEYLLVMKASSAEFHTWRIP
ncbi:MAG: carboxypeptidase regulatory-like domain-containing protein [Candidatus Hydrogenedentes bacterium]|nr:carboxypeptidase regulatory-like domain-containing protein [Candidatus Hydrogenedentota bacterium]